MRAARKILQSSFARSLFLRGAGLSLGLGVNVVLARALGPAQLGIYAYALTVITLIAVPIQSGVAALMVREVARNVATGAWAELHGDLRTANFAVLLLSLLIVLIALPVIWYTRPASVGVWMWALLLLPLYCLATLRGAALRGLQRGLIGQLPDLIIRPACFVLALLIVSGFMRPDAADAMSLHALSAFVAFLFGAIILFRALPSEMYAVAPKYQPKLWARTVLPFTLMAGVQAINSSIGVLLLGRFAEPQEIAFYRVADLGSSLVAVGLAAGEVLIAPQIARLYALGDRTSLQAQVTRITRIMLLTALPIAFANIFFGNTLIHLLFGTDYAGARWPLIVLSIGQLINAGTGSVAALLTMTGNEKEAMGTFSIATVINVVLGVLLIPEFGVMGAAIAAAVELVVLNFIFVWRAKVLLNIWSTPW